MINPLKRPELLYTINYEPVYHLCAMSTRAKLAIFVHVCVYLLIIHRSDMDFTMSKRDQLSLMNLRKYRI